MAASFETWGEILASLRPGPDRERLPGVPKAIPIDLEATVGDLYAQKMEHVFWDTYAGVPMIKFPEDLRTYEHLLWLNRVEVVVELGTFLGGSALWFRDRLRTLTAYGAIAAPRVITIDLEVEKPRVALDLADPEWGEGIELIAGDVCDPDLAARIRSTISPGASCLVIDDSAHTYETTTGALRGYAELIQPGGFFVVEDTVNDIEGMRMAEDWPEGVLPAIRDWLGTPEGGAFRPRRDVEIYGLSCHPGGYLQRQPTDTRGTTDSAAAKRPPQYPPPP